VIGCDLHQIVAESERLEANGSPILIDQIHQLLSIAAHRQSRHRKRDRGCDEETHDQDKDGRQSRLRGAAILQGGASAATVESHHFQASAATLRA
jgi:hypothetical protein